MTSLTDKAQRIVAESFSRIVRATTDEVASSLEVAGMSRDDAQKAAWQISRTELLRLAQEKP